MTEHDCRSYQHQYCWYIDIVAFTACNIHCLPVSKLNMIMTILVGFHFCTFAGMEWRVPLSFHTILVVRNLAWIREIVIPHLSDFVACLVVVTDECQISESLLSLTITSRLHAEWNHHEHPIGSCHACSWFYDTWVLWLIDWSAKIIRPVPSQRILAIFHNHFGTTCRIDSSPPNQKLSSLFLILWYINTKMVW